VEERLFLDYLIIVDDVCLRSPLMKRPNDTSQKLLLRKYREEFVRCSPRRSAWAINNNRSTSIFAEYVLGKGQRLRHEECLLIGKALYLGINSCRRIIYDLLFSALIKRDRPQIDEPEQVEGERVTYASSKSTLLVVGPMCMRDSVVNVLDIDQRKLDKIEKEITSSQEGLNVGMNEIQIFPLGVVKEDQISRKAMGGNWIHLGLFLYAFNHRRGRLEAVMDIMRDIRFVLFNRRLLFGHFQNTFGVALSVCLLSLLSYERYYYTILFNGFKSNPKQRLTNITWIYSNFENQVHQNEFTKIAAECSSQSAVYFDIGFVNSVDYLPHLKADWIDLYWLSGKKLWVQGLDKRFCREVMRDVTGILDIRYLSFPGLKQEEKTLREVKDIVVATGYSRDLLVTVLKILEGAVKIEKDLRSINISVLPHRVSREFFLSSKWKHLYSSRSIKGYSKDTTLFITGLSSLSLLLPMNGFQVFMPIFKGFFTGHEMGYQYDDEILFSDKVSFVNCWRTLNSSLSSNHRL